VYQDASGVERADRGVTEGEKMLKTIYNELSAAWILLTTKHTPLPNNVYNSYPIILIHGFGGKKSNLYPLANYLNNNRLNGVYGFTNIHFFEYPMLQSIETSVKKLHEFILKVGGEQHHLVGHSLGGTIAREYTKKYYTDVITLITLGSPEYGIHNDEPDTPELAIYGEHDFIVSKKSSTISPLIIYSKALTPVQVLTLYKNWISNITFFSSMVISDIGHIALVTDERVMSIIHSEIKLSDDESSEENRNRKN
jgi:hypothetical protein